MKRPLIPVVIVVLALLAGSIYLYWIRQPPLPPTASQPRATATPASAPVAAAQPSGLPPAPMSAASGPPAASGPFAFLNKAKILAERQTTPDPQGKFSRIKLVQTSMKYPYVRVEDSLLLDPRTRAESLQGRRAMVADQLIVKLATGQTRSDLDSINQQMGAKIAETLDPSTYVVQLSAPDLDAVTQAMAAYAQQTNQIAYAEPNYLVEGLVTFPNDPSFNTLWGMHNTGQTGGTADADIDAPEAWDLARGNASILVGVIDTGVDYGHPDLAANIWRNTGETPGNGVDDDGNGYVDDTRGWDFYSNDNDPIDDHFHGTHCAGTIGGIGNNSQGVTGVCWTVSIIPLKFLSADGSGYTSDAVRAVNYATRVGADLTSNSWGGGGFSQALKDAIDAGGQAQILFIAAAGNDGLNIDSSPSYPASYTSACVVSVAATDSRDRLAGFSNHGATGVDLGAPGVAIQSTTPRTQTPEMSGSGIPANYASLSGTSMATPHVAGAVALLLSRSPGLTAAQAKDKLLTKTDGVSALNGRVLTNGRLNLHRLVDSANVNAAPQVNAGANQSVSLPASASLDGTVTDDGLPNPPAAVTTTWSKVSGPGTVTFGDAAAVDTTASFSSGGVYVLRLSANDGASTAGDELTVTVFGPNTAPNVDAGADQTGGSPLPLDGSVSDDGQPFTPGLTTTTWSKVSGPGTVTFGNASSADTNAAFSLTGVYVLRLTATDGALTASDEVQITITALNTAPTVTAGVDQTIGASGSAYLDGNAADDGLPSQPGSVSLQWTKVHGPGGVVFQNPNNLDTVASFTAAGTYTLRLTASDGHLNASDDVQVTVNASTKTPPPNASPTANAGADLTVRLPATAELDGTMRDDGWPNPPGKLTPGWSKLSGPGTVTFGNAAAIDTTVAFSAPGVYVLKLSVSDGKASVSDNVQVTVNPAGNVVPVAFNDSAVTDQNVAVLIPVLANDTDPDSWPNALVIQSVGSPAHGATALVSGQIRYTPVAGYTGADSFTYTITDGAAISTATVTITVQAPPPNQTPTPANDSASTNEEVSILIPVLANDTDPDSGPSPLSISSAGGASHGSVAVSGSQVRYTPSPGFFGIDSFSYTVSDGSASAPASVQVTVRNTALAQNLTSANLQGIQLGAATGSSRILLSGVWEINGTGVGFANPDSVHFEQQTRSDAFEVTARIQSVTGGPVPLAGLMIREGTAASARFVSLSAGGASSYRADWRLVTANPSANAIPASSYSYPNAWVGMVRHGARITLYTSSNGQNWTEDRVVELSGLSTSVNVGLFVCSGASGLNARALVSQFSIQPLVEPVIAAGTGHSLALKDDSSVWSWGLNSTGQLGDGTTSNRNSPVAASALSDVQALAAGAGHSLALKTNGTVMAWGSNARGQLGNGTNSQRNSPTGLSLTGVTRVAAGELHSMALRNNGTVWAWGSDLQGQLGDGAAPPPPPPSKTGTPSGPPAGEKWSPIQVPGLNGIIAIAAGGSHSLALRSDGTVWAWGANSLGQLGDGTTTLRESAVRVAGLNGVIAIAAGQNHSLALKNDGTVWAWGDNVSGQLGDGTNTRRLVAARSGAFSGAIRIAAGAHHSLAILQDGSVAAWGENMQGQLGDGTTTSRNQPVSMTGVTQAIEIGGGSQHSIVVMEDGSVWTAGGNAQGQLGVPGGAPRLTPSSVPGFDLL